MSARWHAPVSTGNETEPSFSLPRLALGKTVPPMRPSGRSRGLSPGVVYPKRSTSALFIFQRLSMKEGQARPYPPPFPLRAIKRRHSLLRIFPRHGLKGLSPRHQFHFRARFPQVAYLVAVSTHVNYLRSLPFSSPPGAARRSPTPLHFSVQRTRDLHPFLNRGLGRLRPRRHS